MHFSVRFPGKVIAPITFYRFNKEHRIRRKSVKITKNVPPAEKHKKMAQQADILEQLRIADELDLDICYCDEIVFSKKDILMRDYTNCKQNLKVRANEIFVGYRAVVATVSSEDGFVYYENH
jgi:hypothetical protein